MPIDGQTVTHHMALFLSITTWAICIWAMDAMNEIAVGLILPVLYIVLCGVKQQVVYSPWLSEVPLIVIGGFALGKILQETGLGKRIGLTCVRCMGGSFTGTLIGITLAVSIVAPLVPAITGKAAIFCAIGISLCDALDFKAKGREATAVILTCCLAVASTKLCYLTGGADLVLGMGLLQKASGISSTWMEYAMHNFLPGMLYTFMSVGLVMLILPSKVDRQALRATLQTKYQELGPVTSEQKRAAILMLVTLILLATDKLHGVAAGLVLIGVTFAAFLPGVRLLDGPKFSKVNFAPLFFIMGCMTIGRRLPQGDHVDRQQHPALSARHDHHNRRPSLLCARRAGQLPLDPARGHHDHDVSRHRARHTDEHGPAHPLLFVPVRPRQLPFPL